MLHTIINQYDIFYNENDIKPTQFLDIQGGMIEYDENNGEKQIVRLHSTNPYLYLKQEYSPFTNI